MGNFTDGLKAGFLGGFGVDYYSKRSSETLEAIRQQGAGQTTHSSRPDLRHEMRQFQWRLKQVEQVLMVDWPNAFATNDLGTVQTTVGTTMNVLIGFDAYLANDRAVCAILDEDAYADMVEAVREYGRAGDAWLAGDVASATRHMATGQQDWEAAVDYLEDQAAALT